MRLHDLKPMAGSTHARKRVGRGPGSGHGTTAGRGMNGQKSRSNVGLKVGFEGGQTPLYRKFPQKKGFNNINRKEFAVVNLGELDKIFEAGSTVTIENLLEHKCINSVKDGVKILGDGELTKSLTVQANSFSKTATEKIIAAGGKAEVI